MPRLRLTNDELRSKPLATEWRRSDVGTLTSIDRRNTDVVLLAANPVRKGALIANDAGAVLYVLMASGVSSATRYSWRVDGNSNFEVPFGFVGEVRGVWASNGAGAARVTEFT